MRLMAHGVGGGDDLPIPVEYAVAGACAALAISFSVLALAWRRSRYESVPVRPAPAGLRAAVDSAWFPGVARVLGLTFFLFAVSASVFGKDTLLNPIFGSFYVLLWVGIVPASLLFGSFYKAVSPARSINWLVARASGGDPEVGLREYPARLGMWPAALLLFAFVWFELVYPFGNELGPVRLWIAVYLAVMLVGGAVFGAKFLENADPFEVFSTLVGRMSVWCRDDDGRLGMRAPLANLAATPATPGLVAVAATLLGSTAFDSFQGSTPWVRVLLDTDASANWLNTFGLLGMIVMVGLLFVGASMLTGTHSPADRWQLPTAYAHSLVPIIVGYFFAHYLSYFVEYGQKTLLQFNDPYTTGANLFGLAGRTENYWLTQHPTTLSVLKVLGVVVGHVVGVVAAHDRALKLLPRRHQLTGQLSMLVVMVFFTVGGLFLLFGG